MIANDLEREKKSMYTIIIKQTALFQHHSEFSGAKLPPFTQNTGQLQSVVKSTRFLSLSFLYLYALLSLAM